MKAENRARRADSGVAAALLPVCSGSQHFCTAAARQLGQVEEVPVSLHMWHAYM